MKLKETMVNSKKIYECFFMELYEDEVMLPNNKKSKRIYIKHDGAAAVLPITKEGKLLLIKQFRYPINSISIEIPAGKKDHKNESGLDCINRELEEETGFKSDRIVKFTDLHSCVGYSNELIEMYIAYDVYKVDHPKKGDDDEFIELLELTVSEVLELMNKGKITDAKTLVALQHYLLQRG